MANVIHIDVIQLLCTSICTVIHVEQLKMYSIATMQATEAVASVKIFCFRKDKGFQLAMIARLNSSLFSVAYLVTI